MANILFLLCLAKYILCQENSCKAPTIANDKGKEVDLNLECFSDIEKSKNGCNITAKNGYSFTDGSPVKLITCNNENSEEIEIRAIECNLNKIIDVLNTKNCSEVQPDGKLIGRCGFEIKEKFKMNASKSETNIYCLDENSLNLINDDFVERVEGECDYPEFEKSQKSEDCSEKVLKGNCTLIANEGYYFAETNTTQQIITCTAYENIKEPAVLPIKCNAFADPLKLKGTLKEIDNSTENSIIISEEEIENKKTINILKGVILQCSKGYAIDISEPLKNETTILCKFVGSESIDTIEINPCVKITSNGKIVGIVLGSIAGIIVLVSVIFLIRKKQQTR